MNRLDNSKTISVFTVGALLSLSFLFLFSIPVASAITWNIDHTTVISNSTEYWITSLGSLGDANTSQFIDGAFTLSINESWLGNWGGGLYCQLVGGSGCSMSGNIDMNDNNIQEIDKAYFDSGVFISSDDPNHLDIHADYIDLRGNLSTIWNIRLTDSDGTGAHSTLMFGGGRDAWIYYNGSDFIIDPDVVGSGDVVILGDLRADYFYGSGAFLTELNVTGNVSVEGDLDMSGHHLTTSFLEGIVGGIDMRGDPWWFSGADFQIATNLIVDGNTSSDWFNGKFNWTIGDTWNSFDGSILDFNESKLDPFILSLGYNHTEDLTIFYDERYLTGELALYFYNETSPLNSSYTIMNITIPRGTEQRDSYENLVNGDNLLTKRILSGLNITILEKGAYNQHTTIDYIAGTKDVSMRSELYILYENGTEVLIGQSPPSIGLIVGVYQQIIWTGVINEDIIFPEGSHLTMYLYATVSGTGQAPDIDLVVGADTASRLDIGINPTDIKTIEIDPFAFYKDGSTFMQGSANYDGFNLTNVSYGLFDFVGIGTDSPDHTLHVDSSTDGSIAKFESSTGTAKIIVDATGANEDTQFNFQIDGSTKFSFGVDGSDSNKFKISGSTALSTNTRLTIDDTGNVGIGTDSPGAILDVNGLDGTHILEVSSNDSIVVRITADGSGDGQFSLFDGAGNRDVFLNTDDGGKSYINNGGNVGIGTDSPSTTLEIVPIQENNDGIVIKESDGGSSAIEMYGSAIDGRIFIRSGGLRTIEMRGNGITSFNGGNVGIGTDSPITKFHISGNSDVSSGDVRLRITDNDVSAGSMVPGIEFFGGSSQIAEIRAVDTLGLQFLNGSGNVDMVIDLDGNVGIGTDSPFAQLHILKTGTVGTSSGLLLENTQANRRILLTAGVNGVTSDGFSIRDQTDGINRFVIDSTGNVGIGTDSPNTALEIGTANPKIRLADIDLATYSEIYTTSDNLIFNADVTGAGGSTNMQFLIDNDEKMRIQNDGNVGIGVTPAQKFEIGSNDGSDRISIYHDNTNAFMKWDDGKLMFQSNEGTDAQSIIDIVPPAGDGFGQLSLDGAIVMRYRGDDTIVDTLPSADKDYRLFKDATEGETREFFIRGFRTGDSQRRTLEIGVGVDADDTASFDGVSNYLFDGNIRTNDRYYLGNGASIGGNATCAFIFYNQTGSIINTIGC